MPTVLIMVMWFGGYVSGYVTTTQQFDSIQTCERAKDVWLEMVKDRGGSVHARCMVR